MSSIVSYIMEGGGCKACVLQVLQRSAADCHLPAWDSDTSIVPAGQAPQPGWPCHSFLCVMLRPLAAQVKGPMVYSRLKFESGVHRVQRVCRPALQLTVRSFLSTKSQVLKGRSMADSTPHSEVVSHSARHHPALSLHAHCRCPPRSRPVACTPPLPPWRSCRRWMMWRSTSTPR